MIDTVVMILVRYGRGGWVEDLPDMLIGRRDHSCSSFVRNNRRVSSCPHNILVILVFIHTGVPSDRGLGILPGRLVIQNIAQKVSMMLSTITKLSEVV